MLQRAQELGASLDCRETLETAARLAVSFLAGACVGYLVGEDGRLRATVASARASAEALGQWVVGQEVDRSAAEGLARVLRLGRSELVDGWPGGREAADDSGPPLPTGADGTSLLAVPLLARGHAVGALVLAAAPRRRVDDPEIVMLAEGLAARAALAIDNAQLYRRAEAAVRDRDEFLSWVAHDLKAPLTHIRGRAELLRSQIARPRESGVRTVDEGLTQIRDATARMARMLNELQDLAQLQAGRTLELVRRPTDLVELARALVAEYGLLSRRHRLSVESAEPEVVGVWDGFRIERVVSNLLSNAIKFSPTEGEVVVAVGREPGPDADWAVLRVADHGVGIPAAEIAAVFEPFRRASNTRGRIGGTGLGLGGSRRIVEQHGGTFELASEEGEGTTVTVRLPIAAGAEEAA